MLGQAERRREVAAAVAVTLDIVILIPYTYAGIVAESWTIIAEALRGVLLISVGIVSFITLRRIHRQRLGIYEYGAGKVEQAVTVMIATLLILAAGVLRWKIYGPAPQTKPPTYLVGLHITMVMLNLVMTCTQHCRL